MSRKTQYLAAPATAVGYTIEADTLDLRTADGAMAAAFARAPTDWPPDRRAAYCAERIPHNQGGDWVL